MICSEKALSQFETDGRVWLRNALTQPELENLRTLSELGQRPGARVSGDDALAKAIRAASFNRVLTSIWPHMRPVRFVSFDKNSDANWGVPWHQDRILSVRQKIETEGFSNWSLKAGNWHCEPPVCWLEKMLFVRIHLDENTVDNGAMEIALKSHSKGKIATHDASVVATACDTEVTTADAGDVLILPMLTLHKSLPATESSYRRVLRVDYARFDLPGSLEWSC